MLEKQATQRIPRTNKNHRYDGRETVPLDIINNHRLQDNKSSEELILQRRHKNKLDPSNLSVNNKSKIILHNENDEFNKQSLTLKSQLNKSVEFRHKEYIKLNAQIRSPRQSHQFDIIEAEYQKN